MPPLTSVRTANAAFKPAYRPVALFVGGTSGIGQAMAETLARHTGGNAHIVICGRDKIKADAIIESLPKSAQSTYEFVQCDVSLMKNVQECTDALTQKYPKINFLVLSPGIFTMQGRTETAEGIDVKLALHFYSRWKFVGELLPSLARAREAGEEAKVMTILDALRPGPIDLNDIDLKKGYSLRAAASHAITGNDIMVAEYASRHPNLAFFHAYPGFVNTPILTRDKPVIARLLSPLASCFAVSAEDCAEWMLYPLLSKGYAKGGYGIDNHGDQVKPNKYVTEESRKTVWEHVLAFTKRT